MNRLTRDELLHRALNMVDSKGLDTHDRPHGLIVDEAHSLSWLQDGLDLFHHEFPWQGLIRTAALSLASGAITLPTDFILDVRDGIVVASLGTRLRRTPLQKFVTYQLATTTDANPRVYTWHGDALYVYPTPAPPRVVAGTLWYYALPVTLGPVAKPAFPSDWVLVEYVRLRGLEWLRLHVPGTARAYALTEIGRLRKAGLQGEPEDNELPLDTGRFLPTGSGDRSSWMGDPIAG